MDTAPAAETAAQPVATTVETPQEPAKAEAPKRNSVPLRELTRLEKQARAQKAEAERMAKELAPLRDAIAKKDVRAVTSLLGVSIDDVVNALADGQGEAAERTPEQIAEEVVAKKLAEKEAEAKKAAEEADAKRIADTHNKFRKFLADTVKQAPEKYELVEAMGAHEEAYVLICHAAGVPAGDDDPWEPPAGFTPRRLTAQEALEQVEAHLRQTVRGKRATRLVLAEELGVTVEDLQAALDGLAKRKGKSGDSGNTPALTNAKTSGVPVVDTDDPGSLDEEDRRRRAMRIALGG